ncbi:hypothetical protein SAMN02745163_00791 [Clostridium cavendishii DSM 21758]|uniref:Uncharacterized protein n=1 Tax=Clostridium cavendishii DSM 21758 TaxID=1121302 RepID=A0A1M6E985_9CLOT|nr:hypothetical protein [Clostridium cavendishii]SHI81929.1 hypothetical protein SAMN02745163_00791 [Clostridium cavendishii DSM 21758]
MRKQVVLRQGVISIMVLFSIILVIGAIKGEIDMKRTSEEKGRKDFNKTGEITFSRGDNFRNQRIKLFIDNHETNDKVAYVLKNPQGEILLKGEVKAQEVVDISQKVYKYQKGIWKIEITKKESEKTTNVSYIFNEDNK